MNNLVYGSDHSRFLYREIESVQEECFIASYGISSYVLSKDFLKLINDKIKDGVRFYFVIGVKKEFKDNIDLGRLFYLKFWKRHNNYQGDILWSLKETKHGKIFIKDNDLALVGSYNFLTSHLSDWDNYSVIIQDAATISDLKKLIIDNNESLIDLPRSSSLNKQITQK